MKDSTNALLLYLISQQLEEAKSYYYTLMVVDAKTDMPTPGNL